MTALGFTQEVLAALAGFIPFLESETLKMEIIVSISTMRITLYNF